MCLKFGLISTNNVTYSADMWFGSPEESNATRVRKDTQSFSAGSDRGQETIQAIINSTTCFDLMRNSSKVAL